MPAKFCEILILTMDSHGVHGWKLQCIFEFCGCEEQKNWFCKCSTFFATYFKYNHLTVLMEIHPFLKNKNKKQSVSLRFVHIVDITREFWCVSVIV